MAVFNEILSGRFNKGLNKLFSIKGPAPAPQLGSEITPVLPMFYGNECRNLEGWARFGICLGQASSAGNVTSFRMRLTKGSLVIAVIEQVTFPFTVTDEWKIRIDLVNSSDLAGGNPVPSVAAVNSMDNRGPLQPATLLSFNNAPIAFTANIDRVSGLAGTTFQLINTVNDELLILPDQQVTFESNTLASVARVNVRWRERILEESEALAKSGG